MSYYNHIQDLSPQQQRSSPSILQKIEQCRATGSKRIDLSNEPLVSFPRELLGLKDIEEIILTNNKDWKENEPAPQALFTTKQYLGSEESKFMKMMPPDFSGAHDPRVKPSFDIPHNLLELLPNLKLLDLRGNNIMGCPDIPGLCLDLSNVFFLGESINIANIVGLRVYENSEQGYGPEGLRSFAHLRHLDISGMDLGVLPAWLWEALPNITHLKASRNKLMEFPHTLPKLQALELLDLSQNKIDALPDDIGTLFPKLRYLDISNSAIKQLPSSIAGLPLEELKLNDTPMAVFPDVVCSLSHLRVLAHSNSALAAIPDAIGNLKQLERLDISRNQLTGLPLALFGLAHLQVLNISHNQIGDLEGLGHLSRLRKLYANHNAINSLPDSVEALQALTFIDLSHCKIKKLPDNFYKLQSLTAANLSNNPLTALGEDIHHLEHLRELDISGTKLDKLPPNLSMLSELQELKWADTPLSSPPEEVMKEGLEAIFYFLTEMKWQGATKIYEAKLLIVGEPDAGKTTLRKRIADADATMPTEDETTKGIDIGRFTFKTTGEFPFRMNIWDFGGQAIYHSTHQFFLTKRSLYVLVLDTRKDDDKLDYWLGTLELFAGDSPIIIVQNKKADRSFPLNGQAIRARYPNVKEILAANFINPSEIVPVIDAIKEHAQQLPHVGGELPLSWIKIRRKLEEMAHKGQHYIDFKDFVDIAAQHKIKDPKAVLTLSKYLHDLGVFLHFSDDKVLKRSIFLQNDWVTKAIYKVLDNNKVKNEQHGRFSLTDLDDIWCEQEHAELKDELLELMIKFELCYPLEDNENFIVPQLLPVEPPADLDWNNDKNLIVRYRYDFMPRGIFAKFLINVYRYISDQGLIWKEGAVLKRMQSRAKIVENYRDRELKIRVQGEGGIDFLNILLDELDAIHRHFPNLHVEKLIPCHCKTCINSPKPYFYEYEKLLRRLERGKETIECEESFEEMNVRALVHGIQPEQAKATTTNTAEVASKVENKPAETLKVLFLAANPKDSQALNLPKEARELMQALNASRMREQIDLVQHWAVTFDDLQQALTDEMPQIVHFSGHGQTEGILLETPSGYSHVATTEVLEKLFSLYKGTVRCIVLNACYSEAQAKVLAQHIPFVIGVSTALMDEAAMAFSIGFYRGLGGRLDIKFAYNSGLVRVESSFADKSDIVEMWEMGQQVRGV